MNYRVILYTIGKMLRLMGLIIVLPMIVAVICKEELSPYILTILIFEAISLVLTIRPPKDKNMYTKEATVSIGVAWIVISLLGALLFVFSNAIPSYTDAVFEMVSGITTTGSSILNEIESLPKGILFFRNFTVYLGGVGILVFMLAISSKDNASSIYLFRAESSGPNVKKMTNKLRDSVIITCVIYITLSIIETVCLLLSGLDFFNAITVSFATAGTGGLSPTNLSIATYGNLSAEIIIMIFMFLFSVNFYVYFLIFTGKILGAFKNEEFWFFIGILVFSVLLVTLNISNLYGGFFNALRYSSFEVISSISSTGFANVDYNSWPTFSKVIILFLFMTGGCAGSTAGGMKMIRLLTLFKASKQRFMQTINPRKVINVKIDGKVQDESYLNSIFFYFALYFIIVFAGIFLVSLDPNIKFDETLFAVFTTFNNIGPGMGAMGSLNSFATLAKPTKWLLSLLMLVGRLEIFPILILFLPSTWKRRKRAKKIEKTQKKTNDEIDEAEEKSAQNSNNDLQNNSAQKLAEKDLLKKSKQESKKEKKSLTTENLLKKQLEKEKKKEIKQKLKKEKKLKIKDEQSLKI